MTYEEAINVIKWAWNCLDGKNYNGQLEAKNIAFIMAIETLEKQIPKKPYNTEGYIDDKKVGIHYCDSCGHFVFYSDRYCNKCGQVIDWSEE